jgi:hypothetical protein
MTAPVIKVKVSRKSIVNARFATRIPAAVADGIATNFSKTNGIYTVNADYSRLAELTTFDPTQELVLVYKRDGTWAVVALSTLINNPLATTVILTSGASYAAGISDKLIAVNKAAGSATAITLPLSSTKVGPVRVVDFKGDANTNNITVNLSGGDTFNGGLTSWKITGSGGSVLFSPILGLGYAV